MCYQPLELHYNERTEKYQFSNGFGCVPFYRRLVPCGKCPECKAKWRSQLAQRVRYELLRYHGNCCFLTLTANPATIHKTFPDGSLDHRPFQLFMKRLRITLERQGFKGKIKYLMCGEYGDNNGRPHYHAIIFGWKPEDLRYKGTSRKGLKRYKSKFLDSIWKDTSATQKEIDDFNNNPANSNIIKDNGGKYDFLPLGFVEVGEVNENTSPYMAKYICKFSEVKREDFEINGKKVKKPYLVYPKKILGVDYFLEHAEDILKRGYILCSNGKKIGIPRSYLKYAEKNFTDGNLGLAYQIYLNNVEQNIDNMYFELCELLGYPYERRNAVHHYLIEKAKEKRKIYESYKRTFNKK